MTTNDVRLRLWVKLDVDDGFPPLWEDRQPGDYACCWCRTAPADVLIGEQTIMPLCRGCAYHLASELAEVFTP
jgi:hypothetical protein